MRKLLSLLFIILSSTPVFADVVWPSLYIVAGMLSAKVIILGLLVELLFVKFFTNTPWLKAGLITFAMNLITTLFGLILIPISGLLTEYIMQPLRTGTFHWSHWLMSYLVIVLINTLIEGLIIKLTLKLKFKSIFWWLFVANTMSVLMCVLFMTLV